MSAKHTRVQSWIVRSSSLLAGLVLTASASATTLLEFDFRQPATGTTVAAVAATDSAVGQLLDTAGNGTGTYATINTGSAVGPGVSDSLAWGSLVVPRTGSSNDKNGLMTMDTGPVGSPNNRWRDYFNGVGVGTFGTGTVLVAYKPNYSGYFKGEGPNGRFTLVNSPALYGGTAFRLGTMDDNVNGNRLMVHFGAGAQYLLTEPINWNASSWYVIAASWSVGNPVRLFVQEIGQSSPLAYLESTFSLADPSGYFEAMYANPLFLGVAGEPVQYNATARGENMNGQMAYFLMTDDYLTSQSGFGQLYASLVPEPSSLLLLTIGAAALLKRRA